MLILPTTRAEKKRRVLERTYADDKQRRLNANGTGGSGRKPGENKYRRQLSADDASEIATQNQVL